MKALLPLRLQIAPCQKVAGCLLEIFKSLKQVSVFMAPQEDHVKVFRHKAIDCEEVMFFADFFQNVDERSDKIRLYEKWISLFETERERNGDPTYVTFSW